MYRTTNLSNIRLFPCRTSAPTANSNRAPKLKKGSTISSRRLSSSVKPSTNSSAYVAGTVGLIGLLGGGTAVYAKYNETFRKTVEQTFPLIKPVLDRLYGKAEVITKVEEKDLSLPFTLDEQEKNMSEEISKPLFADKILQGDLLTSGKDPGPIREDGYTGGCVAINVLDSPAVSQIDIDISNMGMKKKPKEDVAPTANKAPMKNGKLPKNDGFSGGGVVINVLDSPVVSQVDSDIGNMGIKKEKKEEQLNQQSETISEIFPNSVSGREVSGRGAVENSSKLSVEISERTKESFGEPPPTEEPILATENLLEETPLSKEEIKSLSKLVDQSSLEVVLDATKDYITLLSDDVIKAQQEAADSVRNYIGHYVETFSMPDVESLKGKLSEIEGLSQQAIDMAASKSSHLQKEFENFKELIKFVKESGSSDLAEAAENFLNECSAKLRGALTNLDKVNKELAFMCKIENVIKKFPENLRQSVKQFTPELCKLVERYHNEINFENLKPEEALLAYVLKKSELMQATLNAASIINTKQIEELLEEEKQKLLREAEKKMAKEIKRIEELKSEEEEIKIRQLAEEHEKEILSQLKRQASAHNEHLIDELTIQANNLNLKHQEELNSQIKELREGNQLQLEKNLANIQGIQNKITEVVDTDRKQRRIQGLWIASQALYSGLKETLSHGRTRTLMPEMLSILHLSDHNAVMEEIIASFPKDAATIGVIPERELLSRFKQVKSACKKVAMVGEEGGALPTYFLSYLKSLFMFQHWYRNDFEKDVDPHRLDPYELLAKAEHYALEGDLEQTAKFMSQLKGVPRKICNDWLREARLLLETKQTAHLLMAYAASLSVGFE